jgi:uncharacterized alpha-E superfamily protein
LLHALTHQTQTYPGFVGEGAAALLTEPTPEMLSLVTDAERVGGLPQTLQALVQAAWSVRDRLSTDTWRIVNEVEKYLQSLTSYPPQALTGALDVLDALVTSLVAFSALTHENMTHNEGWHFLEAGRRLERAVNTATLLRSTLVPVGSEQDETLMVEAVLGVTDSLITYRRRYQSGTRVGALLDLVFQDESNPRSLAYQVVQMERLVDQMPRDSVTSSRTLAQKLVLRLLSDLRLAELDQIAQPDADGPRRSALAALLTRVEDGMASLSDALTAQYFRHEEQPHNLIERRRSADRASEAAP